MDDRYAARYAHLYRHHWWWRARETIILDWLRRLRPPHGFGPILDVGCGDGLLFERLRDFGEPEGIEENPRLVTPEGRRHGPIHVGPFDASFAPARRYGLILLLDVLEHTDDRTCLGRALALLAPGGRVLVTVPAFRTLWTAHDDLNQHRTRYTKATFARLATDTGLAIDAWEYLFQWTAVLKLGVRLKERLRPPTATPPAVPPRLVNGALRLAAQLERATWGRLPWPFGSSLLVVGRPA